MPNIITAATIAILFNALLGYPMGPVNDIFMRLGISKEPINFLVDKSVARGRWNLSSSGCGTDTP